MTCCLEPPLKIQPAGEPVFKKRRRRRRSGAEDVTPGESVEDGVVTVVKVRDARPAQEKSNDRGRDRKNFDRRERRDRFRDRGRDRSRFNDHREFNRDYKENRRRGTILTDAVLNDFSGLMTCVKITIKVRKSCPDNPTSVFNTNLPP